MRFKITQKPMIKFNCYKKNYMIVLRQFVLRFNKGNPCRPRLPNRPSLIRNLTSTIYHSSIKIYKQPFIKYFFQFISCKPNKKGIHGYNQLNDCSVKQKGVKLTCTRNVAFKIQHNNKAASVCHKTEVIYTKALYIHEM